MTSGARSNFGWLQAMPGAALRFVLVFGLFLCGTSAWAQPDTVHRLSNETQQVTLTREAWFLEDPSGKLTADEVSALADRGGMKRVTSPGVPGLRLGADRAVWLKFDIGADAAVPPDWLMEVSMAFLERVRVFTRSADGQWQGSVEVGSTLPFSQRIVEHRHFVFPVRIESGAATSILLRVQDPGPGSINATLWRPAALQAEEKIVFGAYCAYFGLLAGMLLYNLLLYVVLHDRGYLLYVAGVACLMLGAGGQTGYGAQYLWRDAGQWNSIASSLGYASMLLFWMGLLRHFLQTRERVPWLDRILQAMQWLLACGLIVGAFLPRNYLGLLIMAASGVDLPLAVGVSIWAVLRRWPGATYFCAAWLASQVGALVYLARFLGFVPYGLLTFHSVAIGTALELVLLSLALADRINEERRQKHKAQSLSLAILRASQALSTETRLDRLQARVQEVMAGLTGASAVRFVLWDADLKRWYVYEAAGARQRLGAQEAGELGLLPLSVLRAVEGMQGPLLIEDALADLRFADDPAFAGAHHCAVLALPITHQGAPCALLLLENRVRQGAFSTVALDAVESIAGPLAVSLENVLIYERLEQRVAEQTSKLLETQDQLLATARKAGMAQIATNVLHNVGNVLNGVNVSAELMRTRARESRIGGLTRTVELLDANAQNLGAFITTDAKGRMVPDYLRRLAAALEQEREDLLKSLDHLSTSVDHIKNVVATQQTYAGPSTFTETVLPAELVEDALRMTGPSLESHQVQVVRNLGSIPAVHLDKTRTLQILINLVTNGAQAMHQVNDRPRRMTVQADVSGGKLRFQVKDHGCGIDRQNITRIFSHGFTTRPGGHGFGLHSCAMAASEMGGSLVAESDGPGQGATFTLALPFAPA